MQNINPPLIAKIQLLGCLNEAVDSQLETVQSLSDVRAVVECVIHWWNGIPEDEIRFPEKLWHLKTFRARALRILGTFAENNLLSEDDIHVYALLAEEYYT